MLDAFGSLEALDEHGALSSTDVSMEETMFDIWEAEVEIATATTELDEMEAVYARAEASIEEMKVLAGSIEEFGISSVVMKAMDPKATLVGRGVVVDYNDLDITPVKDANAVAAVEGLGDTIKKMWKKMKEFFAKIGRAIVELWRKIMRGLKSYESAIVAMIKKLEKTAIDDTKLKDIQVKMLDLKDLAESIDAIADGFSSDKMSILTELGDDLSAKLNAKMATQADVDKYRKDYEAAVRQIIKGPIEKMEKFGLKITVGDKSISIARVKAKLVVKKDSLKSHGVTKDGLIKVLKALYAAYTVTKALDKIIPFTEKLHKDMAKRMDDLSTVADKLDKEDLKTLKELSSVASSVLSGIRTLNSWALGGVRGATTMALGVSKKLLTAKVN